MFVHPHRVYEQFMALVPSISWNLSEGHPTTRYYSLLYLSPSLEGGWVPISNALTARDYSSCSVAGGVMSPRGDRRATCCVAADIDECHCFRYLDESCYQDLQRHGAEQFSMKTSSTTTCSVDLSKSPSVNTPRGLAPGPSLEVSPLFSSPRAKRLTVDPTETCSLANHHHYFVCLLVPADSM